MKTVSECLGENLKKFRRERGLTQGQFAKKAGISLSFVQNLEKGKKWAGPKTISTLALALGVSEAELFEDCDRAGGEMDAKQILIMMGRVLGVWVTKEMLEGLQVRATSTVHFRLYELMPDSVCHELADLCRRPGWDWEQFRRRMRG
jgi:transcriptional regulator with XRE-family HTH domain